jgi:putative addiction module killer protein
MMEFKQTETFRRWRTRLKDERARVLIASRLDRVPALLEIDTIARTVINPKFADSLPHRLHVTGISKGQTIIILLCGGDKSSQANDIKTAKRLAKEWREEND